MNIACIIQRYGDLIIGGAELHCRLIAEHLATVHTVEIITTCAVDYLSWENVLPEGMSQIGPCKVRRFKISSNRPSDYDNLAYNVLNYPSSINSQDSYLKAHGPYSPELVDHLDTRNDIDVFIFFSYRYWITCKGLERVGQRSILVPTAEHDRSIYLDIYRDAFRKTAYIAYNSKEEQDVINRATGLDCLSGEIVGVGLPDCNPAAWQDVIDRWDLDDPYIVYIGRIELSKGCAELLSFFLRYAMESKESPQLVMIGKQHIAIPDHSKIRYLGVLPDDLKLAILRRAIFLVMPSRFESLSMVLLEAWRMKRPVIVNAECEVLRGQCLRSQGGLYYRNYDQFSEVIQLMTHNKALRDQLGANGHQYFLDHYSWEVILSKYEKMLNHVAAQRNHV